MRKPKTSTKVRSTRNDSYTRSLLEKIGEGKELLKLRKGTKLFSQGDPADSMYFVETGKVSVSVLSARGRAEVLATVGPQECFGKGCLSGHAVHITAATTTESSTVFRVQKHAMLRAFDKQPDVFEKFIATLLIGNIEMERQICALLFNLTEKRLARVLLKLHRYGQSDILPDSRLSQLTHEQLAEIVGVPRVQILRTLSKFRKLGLIHYDDRGEIVVRPEMLTDLVLASKPSPELRKEAPSRAERHPLASLETVRTEERQWQETSYPGILVSKLFDDATEGYGAIFVKMAAGALYPDHQHKGREQFYVIEGDVRVGADTLHAGDYHRAEGATFHTEVSTDHGCTCIIFGYVGSISAGKKPGGVSQELAHAPDPSRRRF